jgi:glycosyltransferase involved in cell wall biosynthesis
MTEDVLVLIPAYNEEKSIERVIHSLLDLNIPNIKLHLCVISDGSTDKTKEIAEIFPINLIDLPTNLGVGGALRAGYVFATLNGFEKVVHFDADGQHSTEFIPSLLKELETNDLVIGGRYGEDGRYQVTSHVRLAQRVLSLLLRHFHHIKITDPTSGFRATKAELIREYSRIYPTNYLFDTIGSTIQAKQSGRKIVEIFTPMNERLDGTPSQSFLKKVKYFMLSAFLIVFWREGGF